MLLVFFRVLLVILLGLAIFFDVNVPIILNTQVNQLLIAIVILFIIVAIDEIIGFLIGCIFLVVYFKYYQKMINSNNTNNTNNSNGNSNGITASNSNQLLNAYSSLNMNEIDSFVGDITPRRNLKTETMTEHYTTINTKENCIEMPYISNELLLKAQNNIYDEKNYYTEIKNTDNTYGIQGLNSDMVHFLAYDKKTIENNYK